MLASDASGLPGIGGGSAGFSTKSVMRLVIVDRHHAERAGLRARHRDAADGAVARPWPRGRPASARSSSCRCGRRPAPRCSRRRSRRGCPGSGTPRRRCRGTSDSSSMRCCAGSRSTNSFISLFRNAQPRCRWRSRLCDLYCVITPMRRMPEFRQFDSAKSMMRNLPPKYTAGLARRVGQVASAGCHGRRPAPAPRRAWAGRGSGPVRRASWSVSCVGVACQASLAAAPMRPDCSVATRWHASSARDSSPMHRRRRARILPSRAGRRRGTVPRHLEPRRIRRDTPVSATPPRSPTGIDAAAARHRRRRARPTPRRPT